MLKAMNINIIIILISIIIIGINARLCADVLK